MEENMSWLQAKVAAQARALDLMHNRILNQRLQLRTLNELGRGLTVEEFVAARDKVENVQTRERVGDSMVPADAH